MRIDCPRCNNLIDVNMYFYDQQIIIKENYLMHTKNATAYAKGKAACPICGTVFEKIFKQEVTNSDITNLALGKDFVD